MDTFSIIGKRVALVDSAGKTTGQGKYADDLSLPGMLVGKILHSPYPHALIKKIDASRAEALEGVVAVVTGPDAPNKYGILPVGHDETALAVEKVRYVGDNVACVVATSESIAEQALDLVHVEYELLPAWFDPEDSMKAEKDWIHPQRPNNIEKDYHHVFGDPEKGFAEADLVLENRYLAAEVTHAAMEPHSTLAAFEPDPQTGKPGRLTVWSSTQVPYYLQHKLSIVLEMPMSQIRVIKPLVGGGFGGKSEVIPLEIIAAVAARKAKAPVKITYTREEVFWAHRGRPRTIIDLKTGVKKDGRITSVAARVVQDGGAYCSYGVVTILYSGALLGALYDIPNIRYDGYRVLTNKPACGAMRGHGTVNVRFAFEAMLDALAHDARLDPVEVRRRNLLRAPCITVNGLRVTSYGLPECIERVVERSGWAQASVNRVAADTELTPVDLGSYSSRVTFMAGNACLEAAKQMRGQILAAVAKKFGCDAAIIDARDDFIFSVDDSRLRLRFDEAAVAAIDFHGALVAKGTYAPPEDARGGNFKGAGVGPSPSYSYSAQVAEVSVDTETGRVHVHRIIAAHDCGKALNPMTVEGQIEGSVYMGLGQALQEEMVWNKGRLMNPTLLEYRDRKSTRL